MPATPIHELVSADVRRAARLTETGLRPFALAPPQAGRAAVIMT